jgi:hypothetical protein
LDGEMGRWGDGEMGGKIKYYVILFWSELEFLE